MICVLAMRCKQPVGPHLHVPFKCADDVRIAIQPCCSLQSYERLQLDRVGASWLPAFICAYTRSNKRPYPAHICCHTWDEI